MRGLTLTQPWATLIALGEKKLETRPTQSHYRGPIAIHAAKGLRGLWDPARGPYYESGAEEILEQLCMRDPFREVLRRVVPVGTHFYKGLPRASIVAVAQLTEVYPTNLAVGAIGIDSPNIEYAEHELRFGDFSRGRYAWQLTNVRALSTPVEARGMQGLWPVSPTLQESIERQL